MQPFEKNGKWTIKLIPESGLNNIECTGKLYFNPINESYLEVVLFDLPFMMSFQLDEKAKAIMINGISSDGDSYTLLNPPLSQISANSLLRWSISHVLLNKSGYYLEPSDTLFDGCEIIYDNLAEWLNISAFEVSKPVRRQLKKNLNEFKSVTVKYKQPDNIYFDIPAYFKASIRYSWRHPYYEKLRQINKLIIEQVPKVNISYYNSSKLESIIFDVVSIQDFISFCHRKTCTIEHLKIYYKDKEHGDLEFIVFYPYGEIKNKYRKPVALIKYNQIERNFNKLINRWFLTNTNFKLCIESYLTKTYYGISNIDFKLLNLINAIEVIYNKSNLFLIEKETTKRDKKLEKSILSNLSNKIDREYVNNAFGKLNTYLGKSLREKLTSIFNSFSFDKYKILISSPDTLSKDVKEVRQKIAHIRSESFNENDIIEMYRLYDKLEFILCCCILRELSFEEDDIKNFIEKSHFI